MYVQFAVGGGFVGKAWLLIEGISIKKVNLHKEFIVVTGIYGSAHLVFFDVFPAYQRKVGLVLLLPGNVKKQNKIKQPKKQTNNWPNQVKVMGFLNMYTNY